MSAPLATQNKKPMRFQSEGPIHFLPKKPIIQKQKLQHCALVVSEASSSHSTKKRLRSSLSATPNSDYICPDNPELMDSNNPEPNQGTEPTIDTSEWRAQLIPGSRVKFVNKILDMLKNHASVSGHEPNSVQLLRLQCIVLRFEEKVFTTAGSKSDYLRKISMKMLIICEQISKHQANNMPANEVGPNN